MSTKTIEGAVEYKCDLCEESFISASDVLSHRQKNHQALAATHSSSSIFQTNTPAEDEEENRAVTAIPSPAVQLKLLETARNLT